MKTVYPKGVIVYVLAIIAITLSVIVCFMEGNYLLFIVPVLLGSIGSALCYKCDNKVKYFFILTFLINVIVANSVGLWMVLTTDNPFYYIDNKTFYTLLWEWFETSLINNQTTFLEGYLPDGRRLYYPLIDYKLFAWLNVYWLRVLTFLGLLQAKSYFALLYFNLFVVSWTTPLIYSIGKRVTGERVAKIAAFVIIFFPSIIEIHTTLLRDGWNSLVLLLAVYYSLNFKEYKTVKRLLIIGVVFFVAFNLRKANGALILIYFTFVLINLIRSQRKRLLLYVLAGSVSIGGFAFIAQTSTYQKIMEAKERLVEGGIEKNEGENSLGNRFRKKATSNPVLILPLMVYTYFTPIIPSIVGEVNMRGLFFMIEYVARIFLFTGFIFLFLSMVFRKGYKNIQYDRVLVNVLFSLAFWLVVVSFSSGNSRHLILFYPLIILFAVDYFLLNKNQIKIVGLFLGIVGCFGLITYVLLKY